MTDNLIVSYPSVGMVPISYPGISRKFGQFGSQRIRPRLYENCATRRSSICCGELAMEEAMRLSVCLSQHRLQNERVVLLQQGPTLRSQRQHALCCGFLLPTGCVITNGFHGQECKTIHALCRMLLDNYLLLLLLH